MATRTAIRTPVHEEPTGATTSERFHPITERAIRGLADSASFERGRNYARNGWIHDETLRGDTLRAACHGQSGGPYQVEAMLVPLDVTPQDDLPIASCTCTCPRGDFCKHIVALLLTWIDAPERFVVRPPATELLAGKSREEMVAIVELAIRRDPDLADLIELMAPPATPATAAAAAEPGAGRTRSISVATIDRKIARAFQLDGGDYAWDDYHAGSRVAGQVHEVRAIGDGYAAAGRWADALAVYLAIVEKATDEETYVRDDEGDLFVEVNYAAAGLVACLAAQAELPVTDRLTDEDRARLIEALYAFWEYGQDYDFIEEADPIDALAAYATDAERATIAGWLRDCLDEAPEPAAGSRMVFGAGTSANTIPIPDYGLLYRKRAALGFLAELKGEALSQEEMLAEYQKAELWPEAASLLVELGRVDEAIGIAGRKLNPIDLLPFADHLIGHDAALAPRAFDLIEGWLWEHEGANVTHEQNLLNWLQTQYASHNQPERALEAAQRRFKKQPGFTTYQGVQTAATQPGRTSSTWQDVRAALLAHLQERQDWGALVDIHLHEGDADQALSALNRYDKARKRPTANNGYGWSSGWGEDSWDTRRRRVADALQSTRPDEAIRLYQMLAEDAIEGRNRTSYQTAAGHLANAKTVYLAQGRPTEWRDYITNLRETHKRLRALKEELDALDLR